MSAAGSCNDCGATGKPLMKLSLGKDFFGRPYDRLSPSADQSPKWYCEACSMLKNLQRDFRDIRAEFDKLSNGESSAFSQIEERQRAQLRLREIATIAEGQSRKSSLLNPGEVRRFIEQFHSTV
jgi:Lhr-like helicase